MNTEVLQIVDLGRGPQLSATRITVLDVFYYLHRGYGFDEISSAMPSLSREEFDLVVEYVAEHHAELIDLDRRAEQFHARGRAEQRNKGGVFADVDVTVTAEQRLAHLRNLLDQKLAEKHRERHSR